MGYYEFPNTRNYDSDLGFLIKKYKELGNDYDTLVQIYEEIKKMYEGIYNDMPTFLKKFTIEQLQEWLDDGTLAAIINNQVLVQKQNIKWIFVEQYGAIGDGLHDDTVNIQTAVNKAVELGCGVSLMPNKTYLVNTTGIILNNPIIFDFNGGRLQIETNDLTNYSVVTINSDNITIYNPYIIGDRETHTGTDGEWGQCLSILDSNNINIFNGYYEYAWGDGIYISNGNNINLYGIQQTYKCSRNGISIISCDNINIDTLIAIDTNRTLPMASIDIEPNNNEENTVNIKINNIYSYGNQKCISIINRGNKTDNIIVNNIISDYGYANFTYSEVNDNSISFQNSKSNIIIDNITINTCNSSSVYLNRIPINKFPIITINNLKVINFIGNTKNTRDGFLISLLLDRNYETLKNYGRININNANAINNPNNLRIFCAIDNSTLKKNKIEDIFINYINKNMNYGYTTFSYLNNINVLYDIGFYQNEGNSTLNNGFNYITSDSTLTLTISYTLNECYLFTNQQNVIFNVHSLINDYTIYINNSVYNNNALFNMQNKLIKIFVDKPNKKINIIYTRVYSAFVNSTPLTLTNLKNGDMIFNSSTNKPYWYYSGKLYDANGTQLT